MTCISDYETGGGGEGGWWTNKIQLENKKLWSNKVLPKLHSSFKGHTNKVTTKAQSPEQTSCSQPPFPYLCFYDRRFNSAYFGSVGQSSKSFNVPLNDLIIYLFTYFPSLFGKFFPLDHLGQRFTPIVFVSSRFSSLFRTWIPSAIH